MPNPNSPSSNAPMVEISVKAIVLGILLSVILGAANAYLGLYATMTVSASIPAAVVSMGVLRMLRGGTILENNMVMTAASAGEAVAAGAIFTLPGLVILGVWSGFNYWTVTLIVAMGGILGVLFSIPLRRALIVEGNLQFPEGIATAEVLRSGAEGGKGLWIIVSSALVGGAFKIASEFLGLWQSAIMVGGKLGRSVFCFGSEMSPCLISVGYIIGLNVAILVFLGGVANWLVAIPICSFFTDAPEGKTALQWASQIWYTKTRYIGVGAMLIGGVWTLFKLRKSLYRGVASGLDAYRHKADGGAEVPRTERDMPMPWIIALIVASVVPLFLFYQSFVGSLTVSLTMAVVMVITGFLFSAVAGYLAGLVGSSNNPISGVTITTVMVSALILLMLLGKESAVGPAAAILLGSVICVAAAISGDNLQDLKCGYLIGATPWKQQVLLMVGVLAGAAVIAPIMTLLQNAYGFTGMAGAGPKALPALQANLMASVSQGVFRGGLPWTFVGIGVGVAVAIIIADSWLERRKIAFRMPVLAVAIGIYLKLELSTSIFIGGLIHYAVTRYLRSKGLDEAARERTMRPGIMMASGLITGESLMGILIAIPIVVGKQYGWKFPLLQNGWFGDTALGILMISLLAVWLYRVATRISDTK
jgi:putative OPT family oligopeptide transporter